MPCSHPCVRRFPSRQLVPAASGSGPCRHPVSLPIACLLCGHSSMRAFRRMLLAHVWLGTGRKRSPLLCAGRLALAHSASLEDRANRRARNGGSTLCLVGNSVGLASSARMVVARLNHQAKVHATLVQTFTLRRARPNPSLNLTRYGMQRKPGVRRLRHLRTPGLHCMPTRAA